MVRAVIVLVIVGSGPEPFAAPVSPVACRVQTALSSRSISNDFPGRISENGFVAGPEKAKAPFQLFPPQWIALPFHLEFPT